MNKYRPHITNIFYSFSRFLFLFLFLFLSSISVAEDSRIEYKIKAGYLYNFTKFITWPENEQTTFNLCLLGDDPFRSIITPIEKRSVQGKPIRLFHIQSSDGVDHCQLIYSSGRGDKLKFISKGLPMINHSVSSLMVGEGLSFIEAGGMIAFSLEQGRVRLKINLKTLKQSGLSISAKLLEVSDIYQGGSHD